MRRLLLALMAALVLVGIMVVPAKAQEPVSCDLWVEIKGGGTAVISTDTDSPLPDETTLTLAANQIEAFHLTFDRVGQYSYTVNVEPDDRDLNFDETVYLVGIYVTDEDGQLLVNVVVNRSGDSGKYVPTIEDAAHPLKVVFVNSAGGQVEPTDPSDPTDPTNPSGPYDPNDPNDPNGPNGNGGPGNQDGQSGSIGPVIPAANVNAVTPGSAPSTGDASLPVAHIVVLVLVALAFLLVARVLKARVTKGPDAEAAPGADVSAPGADAHEGRR